MKKYTITLSAAILNTLNGTTGGYLIDEDGIYEITGIAKDTNVSCGFSLNAKLVFNTHLVTNNRVGDKVGWIFETPDVIYEDYASAKQALAEMLASRLTHAYWLNDEDEDLIF